MSRLMNFLIIPSTVAVLTLSGVANAGDKDERRLLDKTKISLVEAIQIAERHKGGRAYEASLDDDSFSPEYEVDVAVDDTSYELTIDGITGEVSKVRGGKKDKPAQ